MNFKTCKALALLFILHNVRIQGKVIIQNLIQIKLFILHNVRLQDIHKKNHLKFTIDLYYTM